MDKWFFKPLIHIKNGMVLLQEKNMATLILYGLQIISTGEKMLKRKREICWLYNSNIDLQIRGGSIVQKMQPLFAFGGRRIYSFQENLE